MSYRYETAAPDRYDLLKENARKNRKEMTVSEKVLWDALRHKLQGYKFRRQHAILDYIADFVCLSEKLIIEVDGGYHDDEVQHHNDEIRTHYLEERGFRVIRFKNEEVNSDVKSVILRIKEELNK